MKAKTNENKNKHSARKKLIPAVAMLTTSAIMLSTATYAWFTMNKDVQLTGINLTATVPAAMQISLGHLDNNVVYAPKNTNESVDWSNIVAFNSVYKKEGKLIPASSINGDNIYYTEEAKGVGDEVSDGAVFKQATTPATLSADDSITPVDGYYIDIPVYFRTSETGTGSVNLDVKADITPTAMNTGLYKAARIAILGCDLETEPAEATYATMVNTANADSAGVIRLEGSAYYSNRVTSKTNQAVNKATTYTGVNDSNGVYADVDTVIQRKDNISGESVVTVARRLESDQNKVYGTATKKIIRIWLEGEDTACWNANAGQGFTINLTFTTIE